MDKKSEYWVNQSKTFDDSAAYYDQYRPSYPEALITDIIQKTGVNHTSSILEVGAGSGKATGLFVKRGLNLTCVEPGVNLVSEGQRKFQHTNQVKYLVGRFEELELIPEHYDLIISAQAFHWVPKPKGYQKAYEALRSNQYIGLFWNFYLSTGEEIERELKELFKEYPLAYLDSKERLENKIQQTIDEINNTGYFKDVQVFKYPWVQESNFEEYIGFIKTGNGYLSLNDSDKRLVEDKIYNIIQTYGGKVKRKFECTLFLAQKI